LGETSELVLIRKTLKRHTINTSNDAETKENELNKTGKNIYSPRECAIEDTSFMRNALLWKQKIHKKVLQERRRKSSQVLVRGEDDDTLALT